MSRSDGDLTVLRRDPKTIFAAHILDPDRCDLYVEGPQDRQFIEWLVGRNKHPKAAVFDIGSVDLPSTGPSGRRDLVLAFSGLALSERANIRCLVDADFDRLVAGEIPSNCWRTDLRDLEAYFFRPECLEKVWRLGVGIEIDGEEVLGSILAAARLVGLLRFVARRREQNLPFQRTDLRGRTESDGRSVTIDLAAYARVLLQNAGISLAELSGLLDEVSRLGGDPPQPEVDIPHGKDCVALVAEMLLRRGVAREDAERLVRVSFERGMTEEYPVLQQVVGFLEAGPAVGLDAEAA